MQDITAMDDAPANPEIEHQLAADNIWAFEPDVPNKPLIVTEETDENKGVTTTGTDDSFEGGDGTENGDEGIDEDIEYIYDHDNPKVSDESVQVNDNSELAQMRAQNIMMAQQLEQLKQMVQQGQQPQALQFDEEALKQNSVDFVDESGFNEALTDPAKFNALLNRVKETGRQTALRDLPSMVNSQVQAQVQLTNEANAFWAQNDDLRPFHGLVVSEFTRLAGNNNDKTHAQLFELAEKSVRGQIGLAKKEQKKVVSKNRKPAANPSKGGGRNRVPQAPKKTGMQAEIDRMNRFNR